jgi:hypothetical protein
MMEPTTSCLIVKKLDAANDMEQDQLSEILSAIENLG